VGVVIGAVAALALTRLLTGMLYGITAKDPWSFGIVAMVLALVALLASWIPARRASRVDPMRILRGG
jgi:ABC-type lipoprotein release transport system permease subunit